MAVRKPTREEMREARAAFACTDCGAAIGVQCVHAGNGNVRRSTPDHVVRTFLWRAQQAPDLTEAQALELLRPAASGAVGGGLGWYLTHPGVRFKCHTFKGVATVAVYLHGVAQLERLRVTTVEAACEAGWLLPITNGRTDYTVTNRGKLAAEQYAAHAPGGEWQRLPAPQPLRSLTRAQAEKRRAYLTWTRE